MRLDKDEFTEDERADAEDVSCHVTLILMSCDLCLTLQLSRQRAEDAAEATDENND